VEPVLRNQGELVDEDHLALLRRLEAPLLHVRDGRVVQQRHAGEDPRVGDDAVPVEGMLHHDEPCDARAVGDQGDKRRGPGGDDVRQAVGSGFNRTYNVAVRPVTLQGFLLFTFIPLVLALFLRLPLGPAPSVLLGLAVMVAHRLIAAPWARRHAAERCAWCAGQAAADFGLAVDSGAGTWALAACSARHASLAARVVSLTRRWRAPLSVAIFAPLALLVGSTLAAAAGWPIFSHEVASLQFRLIVALAVVAASLGYRLVREPDYRLVCPFPLHNLLLLGIRQTLWVFRIVGAWWIVDAVARLASR
jgi:hypothetical protein